MKLAKKMLASVFALAMVAALALTAFAAPAVTMTNATANVGETVTITVAGADIAGLESGDLVFTYDAEALEFVEVKKAWDGFDMTAQGSPAAGTVTFSFAYKENATADNAFCTITFKVLKAGAADVVMSLNSWDGIAEPAAVKAVVTGVEKTTETTTKAPETTTAEPSSETAPAPAEKTTKGPIPTTGEASVAAVAGVMAIAAVAFVATRKKDAE